MTVYAEKLLPHDTEAEESVLGSILIDGECLTRLAPLLKEGDFYRERNQLCFDAALSLFQRDQAVDQITLAGELSRTEKLDLVGGMAYLSHLVSITPTSVHAEDLRPGSLPHIQHATVDRRRQQDHRPGLRRHRGHRDHHAAGRGRPVHRQGRGPVPRLRAAQGDIRPVPAGAGVGRGRPGVLGDADHVRVPGPG